MRLLYLFSIILLFSCNNQVEKKDDLVGTWILEKKLFLNDSTLVTIDNKSTSETMYQKDILSIDLENIWAGNVNYIYMNSKTKSIMQSSENSFSINYIIKDDTIKNIELVSKAEWGTPFEYLIIKELNQNNFTFLEPLNNVIYYCIKLTDENNLEIIKNF